MARKIDTESVNQSGPMGNHLLIDVRKKVASFKVFIQGKIIPF